MDASLCNVVVFPLVDLGKRYTVRLDVTVEEARNIRNALQPHIPPRYLVDFT